jgi:aerobic carbon-monoxide dehydrogenase medium subunit
VKPSPFQYVRPRDLEEALFVLGEDPDETKVLAGGQSLVPMMNFRLARPERLIDISRIDELKGIRVIGGRLSISAGTSHRTLETNSHEGPLGDLLRDAASRIGHLPIRTRGTFGGSLAHCDAASEWCVVASALGAEITVRSHQRGKRILAVDDFFQSQYTTAMAPDEILTDVSLPLLEGDWVVGIDEFARRAGDFGIVIVAAAVQLADGAVSDAQVSIGGVGEVPVRSAAAESALVGAQWSFEVVTCAAEAAAEDIDPPNDTHGDGEFRRHLVRALLPRAVGLASAP